jgi:hypothetical protein
MIDDTADAIILRWPKAQQVAAQTARKTIPQRFEWLSLTDKKLAVFFHDPLPATVLGSGTVEARAFGFGLGHGVYSFHTGSDG